MPVTDETQVHHLLRMAQQHRAVAATNMNEHSSRSHSVFRLKLVGENSKTLMSCEGKDAIGMFTVEVDASPFESIFLHICFFTTSFSVCIRFSYQNQ